MQLTIQVFASLAHQLGQSELTVELPNDANVGHLLDTLRKNYPDSAALLDRTAVAVNMNYVGNTQALKENDEVALIPPVSGGSGSRTLESCAPEVEQLVD